MRIHPYLMFEGRCEEALEFYRTALGARIEMLMRFRESPEPPPPGCLPPGAENKIMHASMRLDDAVVMASDGMVSGQPKFDGITLSIAVGKAADADRYFNALAEGGKVTMPLAATFWSPRFGMVVDRFGVSWMINADAA